MSINLAEELLLLAYRDTGELAAGTESLDYGLAGGLLMELMLAGRLALVDGRVSVTGTDPTGEPAVDPALARIAGEAEPQPPQEWVRRLSDGLHDALLDRLTERGILRREREKVMWVFTRTRYPSTTGAEPAPETSARSRLRAAVEDGGPVDARTAALCLLVQSAGLAEVALPGPAAAQSRLAAAATARWPDDAVRRAAAELAEAVEQQVLTITSAQMMLGGGSG